MQAGPRIPASALDAFIICPICACSISNCCTTPCGHRYCEDCIMRHIRGNSPKCPCCNSKVEENRLLKDHQFDSLIESLQSQKRHAESEYVDHIVRSADRGERAPGFSRFFSPIQDALQDYLKGSFLAHDAYYQELKHQRDKAVASLDAECQRHVGMTAVECPDRLNVVKTIERTFSERKCQIDDEFNQNADHIANAYRSHLQQMPELRIIPLKLSIFILCKNLTLPAVILEPHAKLKDIKAAAEKAVSDMAPAADPDSITQWGDNIRVVALGPFIQYEPEILKTIVADVVAGVQRAGAVLIPHDTPLLNLGLKQGSQVVIDGCVMFDSDKPKQCFAETYNDLHPEMTDYFTCQTCSGTNWICRWCKQVCHASHTVVPYVLNHKPGWPCCYCTKTKSCRLRCKT